MAETEQTKRGTFQLSQDRQVLEARLIKAFRDRKDDFDYVLPYDELSDLIGANVQRGTLTAKLTNAMRAVSDDLDIQLRRDQIRNGVYVLPPNQYPVDLGRDRTAVRRKAKRMASKAGRMAQDNRLSDHERTQLLTESATAAAIAAFSDKKNVARIEAMTQSTDGPLSIARTLEAFKTT